MRAGWVVCARAGAMAVAVATPISEGLSAILGLQTDPSISGKLVAFVSGFTCKVQVEYPSEELARVVMTALSVDTELQPDKVVREMSVEGQQLWITFTAVEARFLRGSLSAFMDVLVLATRTVEEFGLCKTPS